MSWKMVGPRALLATFAALSLGAIGAGAVTGASSSVPALAWSRNLAAWLIGALVALALGQMRGRRWAPVALCAAPLGLAATFLSPAQSGVHRWVDLGPVHANVAMLLLPATVVALAAKARDRRWPWLAVMAVVALLAAQPDASQATAFAAAAALIAMISRERPWFRLMVLAAALALAALAWLRPDPLSPVPEVEGIIGMAFAVSPMLAALSLLCVAGTAAVPGMAARSGAPEVRLAGLSLSACLLVWATAPFLGAFPVPFSGVGPSPILGAWIGVGMLASMLHDRDPPRAK